MSFKREHAKLAYDLTRIESFKELLQAVVAEERRILMERMLMQVREGHATSAASTAGAIDQLNHMLPMFEKAAKQHEVSVIEGN